MEQLTSNPPGIWMQADFVSPTHEAIIVHILENELDWPSPPGRRRSRHYGHTFCYKSFGIDRNIPFEPFPDWLVPLLPRTEPRPPDQVCIQHYPRGTGIPPHVDTHSVFDQLYSLSLGSPLIMRFCDKTATREEVDVDLLPRTMMELRGDARLLWTHGIRARKTDTLVDGTVRRREDRWSITYRWLRDPAVCECGNELLCDTAQRRVSADSHYGGTRQLLLEQNNQT